MRPLDLVSASFDAFPSPKGAAVHIEAVARALGELGHVDLVTLANGPATPSRQPWLDRPVRTELSSALTHHALAVSGRDLIARALHFRSCLARWWAGRKARVAHVRGIFEGYPLAVAKERFCDRLVYEVNGLPSIELKYHYPAAGDDDELIDKLQRQEQRCLDAADLVVTPSAVTAAELGRRGVGAERVEVIRNGVDLERFGFRDPPSFEGRPLRLLYVGTMTSWQGVPHALEATRLLRRDHPAELTLVGPTRRRQRRELRDRIQKLGLEGVVELLEPRPQAELCELYHRADVAFVPLPANDRNVVQGCSPLKLLEAMATGVMVVATHLPVVMELASEREVTLVKPSSAKALKDGVLEILGDPAAARRRARAARARIEREGTWERAARQLLEAYRTHGIAALQGQTLP